MSETPILGITEMTEGQSAKHVTFNEALSALDTAAGLYMLGLTYDGSPDSAEIIMRHPAAIAFKLPQNLTNSQFISNVACNATASFTLNKNGSPIGTVEFGTGQTSGSATFSSEVSFAIGDIFTIEAPDPADSTLADLGFTIKGTK